MCATAADLYCCCYYIFAIYSVVHLVVFRFILIFVFFRYSQSSHNLLIGVDVAGVVQRKRTTSNISDQMDWR